MMKEHSHPLSPTALSRRSSTGGQGGRKYSHQSRKSLHGDHDGYNEFDQFHYAPTDWGPEDSLGGDGRRRYGTRGDGSRTNQDGGRLMELEIRETVQAATQTALTGGPNLPFFERDFRSTPRSSQSSSREYTTSISEGSDPSFDDEFTLPLTIRAKEDDIVNQAMSRFKRCLDYKLQQIVHQHGGTSPTGSSSSQSDNVRPGVQATSQQSQGIKRTASGDGQNEPDPPPDNGSSGGSGGDDRPKKKEKLDSAERKLACPFYKRDARFFQTWRGCTGPGWPTMHRLK